MGIKTVSQPPYSLDFAPCDFWLFPKLRGCRYETIEEMKEAVTKVIDTLTQEDFHGAFQKLLEQHTKCIAAGGDYFEGDLSFMCVLSIKVPIRKNSGNLFNDPRIYIYIYIYRYHTMINVYTATLLPTKTSSYDGSGFRHGFGVEASLPRTEAAPAVTQDTTRLGWIVVSLCDCHTDADAVRTLSWIFFLRISSCLMEKVQD